MIPAHEAVLRERRRERSTMGKREYTWEWLSYGFVSVIWFKNCIFRCLWEFTYVQSRWILFGMLIASFLIAGFIWRRKRTMWTVFAAMLVPYGAYAMMTYWTIFGRQISWICAITAFSGVLYIAVLLFRPIQDEQRRERIIRCRRRRCLTSAFSFLAAGMLVFLAPLLIQSFTDVTLFRSSIKSHDNSDSQEYTMDNQMETVLMFQEEKWETLTVQEKLDRLQIIANVEANHLGIPVDVNVSAGIMGENTMAAYSESAHTISFNLDYLEDNYPEDMLEACCHEMYHCYQYRLIDAYRGADERLKGLKIFRRAIEYEREFDQYVEGEEDFYAYYGQLCETDAREYAQIAAEGYTMAIEEQMTAGE